MSLWTRHVKRWHDCTDCRLHEGRRNVVLARGKLPCDVLFIGEAPGESEDVLGQPFVGPAGHLLDSIVDKALTLAALSGRRPRVAFTNLVCCIPRDDDANGLRGGKATEPSRECIRACAPRLIELVRVCQPRLMVLVGQLPKKHVSGQAQFCSEEEDGQPFWIPKNRFLELCEITHPAFILRANVAQQGLLVQRCVARLAEALDNL